MNFMKNNQSLSIKNSQNPPQLFPYLPPPPSMNFMQNNQYFSLKILKVLKLFLQCHKTILPYFVSLPIVLVVHKLLPMMTLKHNFHNFLLKLG